MARANFLGNALMQPLRRAARPEATGPRRSRQRGLTLVELIVAFTIMLVLSSMAVPLARTRIRATRERDLRAALSEVRRAIDQYKDICDTGRLGSIKAGTDCDPETLDMAGQRREAAHRRREDDEISAPPSPRSVHRHIRMGRAQRPGRPCVHKLGRSERFRYLPDDDTSRIGRYPLFGVVKNRPGIIHRMWNNAIVARVFWAFRSASNGIPQEFQRILHLVLDKFIY